MSSWLTPKTGLVTAFLIGEAFMLIWLCDEFCQINFLSPISPQMLSMVLNTNWNETQDFLATFALWDSFCNIRILIILMLMLVYPLLFLPPVWKTVKAHSLWSKKVKCALIIGFLMIGILEAKPTYRLLQLCFFAPNIQQTESLFFQQYDEEMNTPVHRLVYSWCVCRESRRILNNIKEVTFHAQIKDCSHQSSHIVLVIGESYNKHHSQLYGYEHPTAPAEQKRHENGELFVFLDAVTPWNITANVMLNMFSLWDSSAEKNIGEYPLFPILFRRAGYEVNFYSNQYEEYRIGKKQGNQSANFFLDDHLLSDALFSWRNKKRLKYDGDLANLMLSRMTDSQSHGQNTLDIVHLIGQHFNYKARYPRDFHGFGGNHAQERGLDENARAIVESYDNSTLYVDGVLESIMTKLEDEDAIIVFVADHGEEVYDELPRHGRVFTKPTVGIARNEYEVPMWIWCSRTYQEKHVNTIDAIEHAVKQPFVTDDIPFLLCHLAGIRSEYHKEYRNILSAEYLPKTRLVWGDVDYDEIVR